MKTNPRTRSHAIGACLAAATLSGCAGSQSPIGTTGGMPQRAATAVSADRTQLQSRHQPRFLHEYLLPMGAYPSSIVAGSDGKMYFGDYPYYTNHPPTHLGIGRITSRGKQRYFEFGNGVYDVAAGSDGKVWFTNPYTQVPSVGSITTGGTVKQFPTPGNGSPESMAADASGHLWYTAFGGDPDIVEIDTSGATVATFKAKHGLADKVAYGPTGRIWFDVVGNPILVGRITDGGGVREATISGPSYVPGPMALGPDGRMWMCDGDMLAAITRSFNVTLYTDPSGGSLDDVVTGPDGNLWATDAEYGKIVRITTDGTMTEYPTPTPSMVPFAFAVGPDGNIWFTEIQNQTDVSKIGVLRP
jgi:virginiamycin B lyase